MVDDKLASQEKWRRALGVNGILVSNKGRCYREPHLESSYTGSKYVVPGQLITSLKVTVGTVSYTVLQLVAKAWIGNPPCEGMAVKFKDRDKNNRHVDNLVWARRGPGLFTVDMPLVRKKGKRQPVQKMCAKEIKEKARASNLPNVDGEEWKEVERGSGVYVSNHGRCARANHDGISFIEAERAAVNGVSLLVRDMIAERWVGRKPYDGLVARPMDGDVTNKHPDNLVWAVRGKGLPERCFHVSGRAIENPYLKQMEKGKSL